MAVRRFRSLSRSTTRAPSRWLGPRSRSTACNTGVTGTRTSAPRTTIPISTTRWRRCRKRTSRTFKPRRDDALVDRLNSKRKGTFRRRRARAEHRLPHPALDKGDLKLEANLAKVLLGFVMLEGSDNFLQRKTAVDNGLQTIGRYRPDHVLLICSAADGDPADTNL